MSFDPGPCCSSSGHFFCCPRVLNQAVRRPAVKAQSSWLDKNADISWALQISGVKRFQDQISKFTLRPKPNHGVNPLLRALFEPEFRLNFSELTRFEFSQFVISWIPVRLFVVR